MRLKASSSTAPTRTPKVMPTSELILVKRAKSRAKRPMQMAGTKIFMPLCSKLPCISSVVGAPSLPLSTWPAMAGMTMTKRRAPVHAAGIHLPKMNSTIPVMIVVRLPSMMAE